MSKLRMWACVDGYMDAGATAANDNYYISKADHAADKADALQKVDLSWRRKMLLLQDILKGNYERVTGSEPEDIQFEVDAAKCLRNTFDEKDATIATLRALLEESLHSPTPGLAKDIQAALKASE